MKELSQNQQENQDKQESNSLIDYKRIEGTPFTIVDDKEKEEIYITIGNNVVAKCKTIKVAKKAIKTKEWGLILAATAIYINAINQEK